MWLFQCNPTLCNLGSPSRSPAHLHPLVHVSRPMLQGVFGSAGQQHLMSMCNPRQHWMPSYQHCPAPTHRLMMTMTCPPYIKTTIGRSSIGTRSLTQQMKTSFRACYCHCYCQSLTHSLLKCYFRYGNVRDVQDFRPYCRSMGKHDHGLMLQSACSVLDQSVTMQLYSLHVLPTRHCYSVHAMSQLHSWLLP